MTGIDWASSILRIDNNNFEQSFNNVEDYLASYSWDNQEVAPITVPDYQLV
jgi:hypothetical protein